MSSPLALKKNDDAIESRCPACGAALQPAAVICIQCGYDLRSGRRVDEESAPRRNPWGIVGVALLVLLAVGLVVYRIRGTATATPGIPAESASTQAPAVTTPPPAPAPTAETNAAATSATPPPIATNGAMAEVTATETNAIPEEPALDPAMVAAEERPRVAGQLDQTYPLYEVGDELELRTTNGLIQRGVFAGRTEEQLIVRINSNQTKNVDFTFLDRGSRVRCDPQFRERYIDFHVQQRVQKIMQGTNAQERTSRP
jgi:hypothetical protein